MLHVELRKEGSGTFGLLFLNLRKVVVVFRCYFLFSIPHASRQNKPYHLDKFNEIVNGHSNMTITTAHTDFFLIQNRTSITIIYLFPRSGVLNCCVLRFCNFIRPDPTRPDPSVRPGCFKLGFWRF